MTKSQKKSAIFAVIGLMLTFFLIITSLFRIAPARADNSGTNVCKGGGTYIEDTTEFDVSAYTIKPFLTINQSSSNFSTVDINGKYLYIGRGLPTTPFLAFPDGLSLLFVTTMEPASELGAPPMCLSFDYGFLDANDMNTWYAQVYHVELLSQNSPCETSVNAYFNNNVKDDVNGCVFKIESNDGSPVYLIEQVIPSGELVVFELTTEMDAPGEDLPNDNETNPDNVNPAPDVTEKTWQDTVSEWLEDNAGVAVSSSLVTGLAIGIVIYLIIKKK